MKLKSILGVVAAILAIVLAVYFPNRGGDAAQNGAPSASSTATPQSEPPAVRAEDSAASKSAPAASTTQSPAPTASASGTKVPANGAQGATPAAPAKPDGTTKAAEAPKPAPSKPAPNEAKPAEPKAAASAVRRDIGFGSTRAYDEHYEKHGAEFGQVTQEKYLEMAQDLRDAPLGGNVLEVVRDDGVISRFDKKSGAFVAFNKNKTIRTFFKPNDGIRYFERQAEKPH